ncbi:MAG: ribosome maturation factor RimP [Thermicanus sp.]|nr:ribosome maturation factor RimP [Thermicanus sp.]
MSRKVVSITEQLVLPILEQMGLELVEVEFTEEGKNRFLRVYIDKEGGVDIEECGKVSESLSKKLDEVDPIPYAYFLEVSSPGAERPLKTDRDYERAVGKGVHIETLEPVDGKKVLEGILLSTDPLTVKVEGKEITFSKKNVTFARLAILTS